MVDEGTPLLATSMSRDESVLSESGEDNESGLSSSIRSISSYLAKFASRSERGAAEHGDGGTHRPSMHGSLRSIASYLSQFATRSERDEALELPGVGAAAFLIRDAVLSDVENPAEGAYDPYLEPEQEFRNTLSVVCRRLCAHRYMVRLLHTTAWLLVLLSFIEPPYWCRQHHGSTDDNCQVLLSMTGLPATPNGTSADTSTDATPILLYPNTRSMLLDAPTSRMVEMILWTTIVLITLLRIGRDGLELGRYLRAGRSRAVRCVQLMCLGIMPLAWCFETYLDFMLVYLRLALLLSYMSTSQRDIRVLWEMLPEVLNILTLLAVLMTFWAWFGVVMFIGTPEGTNQFSSLVEGLWTLWICVTTANYPDVMMDAYNQNRWAALYFVSFMIVSFFFLMNVVLAVVVNAYDAALQAFKESRKEHAAHHLTQAYELLADPDTGRIDRKVIMALFCILNEDFYEFRRLSDEDTKLLFAILDRDGSSTITKDEFMSFGSVLLLEFVKESDYQTFVERRFPKLYATVTYQRFCRAVQSDFFEYTIDGILVLNAVVIGIQSYPALVGDTVTIDPKSWDGDIDTVWELLELLFTITYVLECTVKIIVYGWKQYSESLRNIFDLVITVLAVLSAIVVYYPNEISDSRIIRMIVMFRVVRLIRLLLSLEQFQMIGTISAQILPAASSVMTVLFFVMSFFSAMGVQLYGGMITRDPDNPLAYLVLGTDFSDNDYWANNFNDMISGMNVLFNLLVINNWTECEVGFEAVTEAKWVRFFFLAFHILGVILVNNLVIAFIINAFFTELAIYEERTSEEVVGEGEAVIRDRRARFDASEVTGTKTTLTGGYIARLRHSDSDVLDEGRDQQRLRTLFTHTSSSIVEEGDSKE